ncbi:hypothetical protein KI387_020946, partial [Taxus chinensis]
PQSPLYSTVCEACANEKHTEHSQYYLSGNALKVSNLVEGKQENKVSNTDMIQNNGRQNEIYDIDHDEVKMAVKRLQEAMDPFYLDYTTRGNWWQ